MLTVIYLNNECSKNKNIDTLETNFLNTTKNLKTLSFTKPNNVFFFGLMIWRFFLYCLFLINFCTKILIFSGENRRKCVFHAFILTLLLILLENWNIIRSCC